MVLVNHTDLVDRVMRIDPRQKPETILEEMTKFIKTLQDGQYEAGCAYRVIIAIRPGLRPIFAAMRDPKTHKRYEWLEDAPTVNVRQGVPDEIQKYPVVL